MRVHNMFPLLVALLLLGGCHVPKTGLTFRQLDYGLPVQYADVDGLEIAYVDRGAGPPVVLLHGLGSNLLVWRQTIEALESDYRVIAIDLPGYGRSSKASYDYSMAFFARVVERTLDRLGVRCPILVGHSMGGQIAMTFALRYPTKLRGLALVAPAGFETFTRGEGAWLSEAVTKDFIKLTPPDAIYTNLANNFAGDVPKEALFMYAHRVAVIDSPEFDDYAYANSRSVRAMVKGPVFDRLPELTAPVLVVFGDEDKLIPNQILHAGTTAEIARRGVERLPNARLILIPRAGHMLQIERPREWTRALRDFLLEVHR